MFDDPAFWKAKCLVSDPALRALEAADRLANRAIWKSRKERTPAGLFPVCHRCRGPVEVGKGDHSWRCCQCGAFNRVSLDVCEGCAHDPHMDWQSFVDGQP